MKYNYLTCIRIRTCSWYLIKSTTCITGFDHVTKCMCEYPKNTGYNMKQFKRL